MREYAALKTLRSGDILDIDGLSLVMDEGDIKPGDLYVGERNAGPQLLTARKVDYELGCIFPTCTSYPYDLGECIKIKEVN